MKRLLLLALLVAVASAEKVRFDSYRVYRVFPANERQVHLLKTLENAADGLNFWSSPGRVNGSVDIMVPPHKMADFQDATHAIGLTPQLYIQDVQKLIDNERPQGAPRADFGWTDYYPLGAVYAWLDAQVANNPNVVSSIVGGSTYEGRKIQGVKISYKQGNPGIFIESGIHAREWITVATVTYIVNELLTSTDPAIRNIAENYDWYVFPSTNPDGYEYTHTTNRMWRKTRSKGTTCDGADPNRNWDYHWMEEGASSSPCSEGYAGTKPFSEIETSSLSEYLKGISKNIKVYLSFHSYSQLLLIPYGVAEEKPPNYNTLMEIGQKSAKALAQRYGTQYEVGSVIDVIYPAAGISSDWARKSLDIPYTFTWELRDTGRNGFILPAEQIIPTALETLDSVLSILEDVQALENK